MSHRVQPSRVVREPAASQGRCLLARAAWPTFEGGTLEFVSTQTVTVELDGKLVEASRAAAERLGQSPEAVIEQALRDVIARDFSAVMDEIAKYRREHDIFLTDGASWKLDQTGGCESRPGSSRRAR
jgi:predicted transcriptional regulator